ncbi:MAG: RHS repeat-associated core domain-containing protein [Prevotella sp.]|nr:RHS repeat-associated core domain-containing protein [Prevotella sp.]
MTVTDPVTHRTRSTTYHYESPATTINFGVVKPSCFVMPGGTTLVSFPRGFRTYTSGATLTSLCRIPGKPLESAEIYYARVTEDVTGTGLAAPLRTVYEYDLTDIEHPFIPNGGLTCNRMDGFEDDEGRYYGSKIYDQNSLCRESFLFAPHIIRGHYRETCWEHAPLIRRTIYRHTAAGYEPAEEERHWYSTDKEAPMTIGLYVDKVTRSIYSDATGFTKDVTEHVSDFNWFEITVQAGRLFRDSTAVTHYYPGGHSRRILAAYTYDGRRPRNVVGPVFPIDSLIFLPDTVVPIRPRPVHESPVPLLRSVCLACQGEKFTRSYLYSSNLDAGFYRQITDSGYTALPVEESVVVGSDTVRLTTSYRHFDTGGLQRDSLRILYNGRETARQDFYAYDRRGNLLFTAINGGVPTAYQWDTEVSTLTAAMLGGGASASPDADSVLTTSYTYEPLVGCTGITTPDGRHTAYGYAAGRLSEIRNSSGQLTDTYAYSLYGSDGSNLVSHSVYTDTGGRQPLVTDTYYDGLGAAVTSRQRQYSPMGSDLATLTLYDGIGRKTAEWLPVPVTPANGPVTASELSVAAAQAYGDSRPLEEYHYEEQPDGEQTAVTPAGEAYQQHPATTARLCSDPAQGELACRRLTLAGNSLRVGGLYAAGELDVTLTADADGRRRWTFTDWRGQKVLDRIDTGSGMADTYYIYDPVGNLRMVLPPAASERLTVSTGTYDTRTDTTLLGYAYQYRYDNRLRCVERCLPGCKPVRYLYDRTGQAVLAQDGNARRRGVWTFTLPDRYGRPAITGECTEPDTAAVGRVWAHVGTACFANMGSTLCGSGYTANIPIAGAHLLKAIYYDDYEFLMAMPQEGMELCPDTLGHRGLQTGFVCATGNDGTYRVTKLDYDSEGRVMLTQTFYGSSNAAEVTAYTHDGRVARRSILTAGPDGRTHTEDYRYSYDAQARLLRVTHSLDGGAERTLADNVYDALGRVTENRREGSGMLTARYSYDVRSRIREIACPLFSQHLYYAESSEGGAPQYGGNISAMDWQTLGDSLRGYRYAYDGMGRLVGADYREMGRPSDHYSTEYAYDLQGNILALRRNGRLYGSVYGVTDDLTYEYDGNRLTKVTNLASERSAYKDAMYYVDWTDLDTERAYDANGNMVSDADRQITRISYDQQNLPRRTDYLDGSHVDYTYDADGVKLRVDYYLSPYIMVPGDEFGIAVDSTQLVHTWREYVGNSVYENDTLRMVLIDGGYITFDGASHQPLYHYYAKDYLGNNRAVTDEAGRIEEINHYYPFGGLMGDSWATATQPYKYIGKELDRTHGLDWYDHGARHYDPVTGRWNVVDAMAEKYYPWSPYASCGDDPVNTIDENGMDWYTDIDKTFQYNPQVHSQKDLSKGQMYKGAYFTTGKGNSQVTYRRDGSILYANETKAYNRIWNQASVHYRRMGEKGGREVAAFILADGRVLVLPDYKNDNTTSRMDVANYRLTRRTLSNGKENFLTIGQVHTHQDRSYPATPSYYTLDGYGDLGYSKDHASLPVFTLGHDGQVHGIRGCTNSNGQVIGLIASIRKNEKSLQSLLNGRTSLYSLIKRLPTIKR